MRSDHLQRSTNRYTHQLWDKNEQKWGHETWRTQIITNSLRVKMDRDELWQVVKLSKHNYTLPLSWKWTQMGSICLQGWANTITHWLWVKTWIKMKSVLMWGPTNIISHQLNHKRWSIFLQRSENTVTYFLWVESEVSLLAKISKHNYPPPGSQI